MLSGEQDIFTPTYISYLLYGLFFLQRRCKLSLVVDVTGLLFFLILASSIIFGSKAQTVTVVHLWGAPRSILAPLNIYKEEWHFYMCKYKYSFSQTNTRIVLFFLTSNKCISKGRSLWKRKQISADSVITHNVSLLLSFAMRKQVSVDFCSN